jgi:glycosyltransferase involved in cell wall biosynthesis
MKSISPKISIIMPVYNAGDKLTRCLDTMINQTMSDIEMIIILDSPTDGSDEIVKSYAKRDSRIILIENDVNLHIGLSRNKGLEIVRGEYVGFSDHDDYREPGMYEALYNYAKQQNADMIIGKSTSVGTQTVKVDFADWNIRGNIVETALMDLIEGGKDAFTDPKATNIHPNLYKASIIRENNIRFVDTRRITPEDRLFNIEFLLHAHEAMVYDQTLYYHLAHDESEGKKYSYVAYESRAAGKQYLFDLLHNKNVYDKYEPLFLKSVKTDFAALGVNAVIKSRNPLHLFSIIRYLKSFEFSRKAFQTVSNEVFVNYRFIGRTLRIMFNLLMR